VRNLPSLLIKVTSLGASNSDIPPQGASGSTKPVEDGDLHHVASKVGRFYLAKTKFSGSARRRLKKFRESQSSTRGLQQLGYMALPKVQGGPGLGAVS
jgi:hypothetical protein